MNLPKHTFTWLMTLLLIALAALAGWMFWALGKVEDAKQRGPTPAAPQATSPTPSGT